MNLPPPGSKRWSASHKVAVIMAIRNEPLSTADVRERYMLSDEELASWQTDFDRHGISDLQVKSMKHRRRNFPIGKPVPLV
jgi:hypothetical protein